MQPIISSAPATGLNARHMFSCKQAELDELFSTLSCPEDEAPQEVMRGYLFGISGINALPRPVHSFVYRLLASFINPWKGKSFHEAEGANLWLSARGSVSFAHYHVSRASGDDGKPLLFLDYRHPRTPGLLTPIRGEARLLSAGVWLARMRWQTRRGLPTLLYFTLEANA